MVSAIEYMYTVMRAACVFYSLYLSGWTYSFCLFIKNFVGISKDVEVCVCVCVCE